MTAPPTVQSAFARGPDCDQFRRRYTPYLCRLLHRKGRPATAPCGYLCDNEEQKETT